MTNVQARDTLIGQVLTLWAASAYSAVPIYWHGGPQPTLDNLDEFVYGSVIFRAAEQASIDMIPETRLVGGLKLTFFRKEPNGDRRSQELAEYLCDRLAYLDLSGVVTTTPGPLGGEGHDGWYSTTWEVPFWFYK